MKRLLALVCLPLIPFLATVNAADFPLTGANTTVTWIGTKPEGKHDGGFKSVTGKASVTGTDPTTLKITLDIDTSSLYADKAELATHLKSPDFFGVKANPKATFVTTKIEKDGADYKITGDFTMLKKTKSITVPAKITATADALTVTSSFTIDRTQWGMKYGQGKIDNEVKLTVSVKAKK